MSTITIDLSGATSGQVFTPGRGGEIFTVDGNGVRPVSQLDTNPQTVTATIDGGPATLSFTFNGLNAGTALGWAAPPTSDDIFLVGGLGYGFQLNSPGNVPDFTGVMAAINAIHDADYQTPLDFYQAVLNAQNLLAAWYEDVRDLTFTDLALFSGGVPAGTLHISESRSFNPEDPANGLTAAYLLDPATNFVITGSDFDDNLAGGAGADQINGGDDRLGNGGIGDTVSYADSTAGVSVDLSQAGPQVSTGFANGDVLTDIENVTGSAFGDVLTGDGGDNTLAGGDGHDVINGGAGADTLRGEAGNDTLSYAGSSGAVTVDLDASTATDGDASGDQISGFENLIGSAHGDSLSGDAGANTIDGSDGDDIIRGAAGADVLIGGAGSDTLSYAGSNAAVTIDLAAQTATGGHATGDTISGFENVVGSDQNDTFIVSDAANAIDGGAGTDTVSYANATTDVWANLTGGTGGFGAAGDVLTNVENLTGSAFDDVLSGSSVANVIDGGAGDDFIIGGAGADRLTGGANASFGDGVSYMGSTVGVTVNLALATAQVSTGDASGDILSGFENLEGSSQADTLLGNAGDNLIRGHQGNDIIEGGAGADNLDGGADVDTLRYAASNVAVQVNLAANTATGGHATGDTIVNFENVIGSNFNDELVGSVDANVLDGGVGNDVLEGGAGADTLNGGAGVDTARYASSVAGVYVDLSFNSFSGGDAQGDTLLAIENVIGSAFNDILVGNAAANNLIGGAGADFMEGKAGADVLDGGSGVDTAAYVNSTAGVVVNLTTNTASGGDATGDIISNFEDVFGSNFADSITGSAGNNMLRGRGGNDTLSGMAGDDTLYGGNGADTLNGGDGIDTVRYADEREPGEPAGQRVIVNLSSAAITIPSGPGAGGTVAAGKAVDTYGQTDTLVGIERVVGTNVTSAGDIIYGNDADNDFVGLAGNDLLVGKAGDDNFVGGDGADTFNGNGDFRPGFYDDEFDVVDYRREANESGRNHVAAPVQGITADLVAGTITDTYGNTDIVIDIEGVRGTQLDDNFTGSAQGEDFIGLKGSDIINGGGGNDTIRYDQDATGNRNLDNTADDNGTLGVVVNLGNTNIADLQGYLTGMGTTITTSYTDIVALRAYDGWGDTDVVLNIERVRGTEQSDIVIGSSANNRARLGAGADFFDGADGTDMIDFRAGGGTLTFGAVANLNAGAFSLTGPLTAQMAAGVTGGYAGTSIAGQSARDYSGATDEFRNVEDLRGSQVNDLLIGNALANEIHGEAGNDYLLGGLDEDRFVGGQGNDIIDGRPIDGSGNLVGDVDDYDRVKYGDEQPFAGLTGAILPVAVNLSNVARAVTFKGASVTLAAGTARDIFGDTDTLLDIEEVIGTNGNDVIIGSSTANIDYEGFFGLAGDDVIEGGAGGFDQVRYDLDWDYRPQVFTNPTYGAIVNLSAVSVTPVAGVTIAAGRARDLFGGIDTLSGIEGARGSHLKDYFYGGAGDEYFRGMNGADYIKGGAGFDYADYRSDSANLGTLGVVANLSGTNVIAGGSFGGVLVGAGFARDGFGAFDQLVEIEGIVGSDNNDYLVGSDLINEVNELRGRNGDDILIGLRGVDRLFGDGGNDTLEGGAGEDWLYGGAGNDILRAGAEYDVMIGGAGFDVFDGTSFGPSDTEDFDAVRYDLEGGSQGVIVNLLTGVATDSFGDTDLLIDIEEVLGTAFVDRLTGGNVANNDWEMFYGLAGADRIDGGSGFDEVRYDKDAANGGSSGIVADLQAGTIKDGFGDIDIVRNIEGIRGTQLVDIMNGDNGNNRFRGLGGADVFDGRGGIDTVDYSRDAANGGTQGVTVNLATGIGKDGFGSLDLIFNVENVIGTDAIDQLTGTSGNNTLDGRGGNDLLVGGLGTDILIGGAGNDVFRFTFSVEGGDFINDFAKGQDRVEISASGFTGAGLVGSAAGTMVTAAQFLSVASGHTATTAGQRFIFDQSTDQLWFDSNGSGVGGDVLIATFTNNPNLANTDLFLIL
ncbi:MAG TPA: calcium-binding protein [Bosea sp. (in: a-proteobacteria)]|jgi:Ca2+-binding RTX toxin-like protein|nr:calcium-binding protein [Bosea sp. (in: a-proteobacteria)]